MTPGTEAVVNTWVPLNARSEDPETLSVVMGVARKWVANTAPSSPKQARAHLRALVPMLVSAHHMGGSLEAERVLVPDLVEYQAVRANADKKRGWRQETRRTLRKIGRANNPRAWPSEPQPLGYNRVSEPYTNDEEVLWRSTAARKCRAGRTDSAWAAVGSLGAGIAGIQLSAMTLSDIVEIGEGRLGVRITGPQRRLIPIRGDYTELARMVIESVTGPTLMRFQGRNAAHRAAHGLAAVGGEGLSYRRARSTWLAAHLRAGTPLPALWAIAGPLSARTLTDLLDNVSADLDADTAARQGLNA